MKLLKKIASSLICMLAFAGAARAQDRLVPAGTLLQCVMDDSNFSSSTASLGDPVLCHLRTLEEFGRPAFPKGAMLGGHLEDAQGPCRFSGKGYVNITFDRVILPYGDLPLGTKVIQPRGCKAGKSADNSKGQAHRRSVGWLTPLQPWKLALLPIRGPRSQLQGEEQLELRTMEDILIPSMLVYGSMNPERPLYMGLAQRSTSSDSGGKATLGLTMLVLKSDDVYAIRSFRLDAGNVLRFNDSSGKPGVVDANEIDWLRTGEMTSASRSAVLASLVPTH